VIFVSRRGAEVAEEYSFIYSTQRRRGRRGTVSYNYHAEAQRSQRYIR